MLTPPRFTVRMLTFVAMGGFVGGLLRAGADAALPHVASFLAILPGPIRHCASVSGPATSHWCQAAQSPGMSTLVVNWVGAFLLGVVTAWVAQLRLAHPTHPFPDDVRLMVGTGLCGALTTYSSLSVQIVHAAGYSITFAALWMMIMLIGGVVMAWWGLAVGRRLEVRWLRLEGEKA